MSWTTGAAPDIIAPMVNSTIPVNAATGVAVNSAMTATFSEAMDPLTITTVTFTLTQGARPITGTVIYAGVTATFAPAADLESSTIYTATITAGAKDLAGNALSSNYTWNFTTYHTYSGGGVTLSSAKAITAFDFTTPAVTGVINEAAKTIAVTVPFGTNLTALIATFTTTGTVVKVGAAVQTSTL
ncbi:MAG: Ig-like domain-containing protein [Dehalococcoidia bacterium]